MKIVLAKVTVNEKTYFRFEVLTVVTTKITVFWDLTLYNLVDDHQYLGGTCCLHLHSYLLKMPGIRFL
jgi:hypothetical protein